MDLLQAVSCSPLGAEARSRAVGKPACTDPSVPSTWSMRARGWHPAHSLHAAGTGTGI